MKEILNKSQRPLWSQIRSFSDSEGDTNIFDWNQLHKRSHKCKPWTPFPISPTWKQAGKQGLAFFLLLVKTISTLAVTVFIVLGLTGEKKSINIALVVFLLADESYLSRRLTAYFQC